jgi:hypothetical protein
MTQKHTRQARKIAPDASAAPEALPQAEAPTALVPSDAVDPAPTPTEPPLPAVPTSAEEEAVEEEVDSEHVPEPLPKEYVVLSGPASFGPVIIGGARVQARNNRLYYVPDAEERADILGTGRFRAARQEDLARAGSPSARPGVAITRDLLPPGAVRGGLIKP